MPIIQINVVYLSILGNGRIRVRLELYKVKLGRKINLFR